MSCYLAQGPGGMAANIGDGAITDMQQHAGSLYAMVEWHLRSFRRRASVRWRGASGERWARAKMAE
jgi:hypothetical protein